MARAIIAIMTPTTRIGRSKAEAQRATMNPKDTANTVAPAAAAKLFATKVQFIAKRFCSEFQSSYSDLPAGGPNLSSMAA